MLDPPETVVERAARELGRRLEIRHDRSWTHGESSVFEVTDPDGTAWIVKQVRDPGVFESEVHALRSWAPRLGEGLAPALVAAAADRAVMVMDRLPGESGTADTAEEYRQAGRLIRRLHDAGDTAPDPDCPARAAERVDRWVRRLPGVVDGPSLDFVRAQIRLMDSMDPVRKGPIHNDNQPRNWLTDSNGTVRIIDFGKAKVDVQVRDFERLRYREWTARPELRDAFFDGYGRALTDHEEGMLACIAAVSALTTILWARAHAAASFELEGRRLLDRLRAAPGPKAARRGGRAGGGWAHDDDASRGAGGGDPGGRAGPDSGGGHR